MPKDLKGRELPKGIYQRKDGRYEARAMIHGNSIQLYNYNLKELKADFEKGTKICSCCRKELPLKMFYKNKSMSDNLCCDCIQCRKNAQNNNGTKQEIHLENVVIQGGTVEG